jgi:hypothetical protein
MKMAKKNQITSITFLRNNKPNLNYVRDDKHKIVISLKKKIPGLGYGTKEIRKLLKDWQNRSYDYRKFC